MPNVRLSLETRRRLDALFTEADREKAAQLLITECGDGLPFHEGADEWRLERVRFAALKLSDGDPLKLGTAIQVAQSDWRDLLMAAGFGHDVRAHESWFPDNHRAQ